jgi:hypothetical protein
MVSLEGITLPVVAVPNGSKPFVSLTSSNDRQIFERQTHTRRFRSETVCLMNWRFLYATISSFGKKFHNQNDIFLGDDEQDTVISDRPCSQKGKSR